MHHRTATGSCIAVLVLVFAACSERAPMAPEDTSPMYDFVNGPESLANVLRFEDTQWGSILDPAADLRLNIGLPANPLDVCPGGTGTYDTHEYQITGVARDVWQLLAVADVHLHLYQLSTYINRCRSLPFASGIGRLVVTDNDAQVSGTRVNSFGATVTGVLTLPSGETVRVTAHARMLIQPGEPPRVAATMISLSRGE